MDNSLHSKSQKVPLLNLVQTGLRGLEAVFISGSVCVRSMQKPTKSSV